MDANENVVKRLKQWKEDEGMIQQQMQQAVVQAFLRGYYKWEFVWMNM